jgi:triacylglycerol esterase/lipase EstA (alpha/beta hydrolase family)
MKSQGRSDSEIINDLKEQGIPPKMIQEAMAQAQIKEVVTKREMDDMQQSIMNRQQLNQQETYEDYPADQTMQAPAPDAYYDQGQFAQQDMYSYPQGDYPQDQQQQYYSYSGTTDTGTLIEIAEQVFTDKIKKIEKQIEALNEFKVLTDTRLNTAEERLKRIETMIDKLQISILEKIGGYGDNLDSIKKEMSMMQDSFAKVVNPVLDKAEKKILRR